MDTELTTPGTTAIATVPDVAHDLHLVASNVEEMRVAQTAMAEWFAAKEQICLRDSQELRQNLEIAEQSGWKTDTLKRHANLSRKRAEFYEKCKLAAEAGYSVIPNLPATLFAIRTEKSRPSPQESTRQYDDRGQRSESPPAGDGEFVDASPIIKSTRGTAWNDKTKEWEPSVHWKAADFDEVEFPISMAKPSIMSEAARAMALKVFDELAIVVDERDADARRKKGDPLLLGIIRKPSRTAYTNPRVTFLIGWYVNTADI